MRIPPGHVFMFVGVWGCGVGGLWGCGFTIKNEMRKVLQIWLKNDAQTDALIRWSPFQNNSNSERIETNKYKLFSGGRSAQGWF